MAKSALHIADYDETAVKRTLDRMASRHGVQPGDPKRIAKTLLKLSRLKSPPLRFATGEDGIDRMHSKLDATKAEANQYRQLGLAVTFDSNVDIDQL